MSISQLAALHADLNELEQAEQLMRESVEGRRFTLGPDHADTLRASAFHGVLLARLGRVDEGLAAIDAALEAQRAKLGPTHPNVVEALSGTRMKDGHRLIGSSRRTVAPPPAYFRSWLEPRMTLRRHPVAVAPDQRPLAGMPVDRRLVARLSATYAAVREQGDRFATVFYGKLFAAAPQLRSMFREEPAVHARKLLATLETVVANFNDPSANAALLADLGRRHAGYGARPNHYALVVDLLTDSMRETLGPAIDTAGLEEWRTALRLISDQMIAAAAAGGPLSPPHTPSASPPAHPPTGTPGR